MTELTGIGARLRQAREAQGLAVDEVAQSLKFAPRQIESLENERFDRLPGPTIARGMVRNYARLLKLDPEPLIERMAPPAESGPDAGLIAEHLRREEVPFSDGGKRSTLIYAGFSVGILVLVGAVAYEWQQQKTAVPEFVAPARERPPQAATQPAPAPPAPAVPVIEEKKPVAVEEKKAAPAAVAAAAAAAAATAAAVEKPLPPGERRIVLRCEADAWVEIKDGAGRMLVSALQPAGTERSVRGAAPFDIVIGNAASVKLTYEGKPVDLRPHTRVAVARLTLK